MKANLVHVTKKILEDETASNLNSVLHQNFEETNRSKEATNKCAFFVCWWPSLDYEILQLNIFK